MNARLIGAGKRRGFLRSLRIVSRENRAFKGGFNKQQILGHDIPLRRTRDSSLDVDDRAERARIHQTALIARGSSRD